MRVKRGFVCISLAGNVVGDGEPQPSKEGLAEWIPFERIGEIPVVEDLPVLLTKIHAMRRGDPPFSARSFYDQQDNLVVKFGE